MKLYEHTGDWSAVAQTYDVMASDAEQQTSLSSALYKLGSNTLLEVYLGHNRGSGGGGASEEAERKLREIQYQAAIKNTRWDMELPKRYESSSFTPFVG